MFASIFISLSYASSGDEELIELTANFDDDDDDDDDCEDETSAFRIGTEMIDKEMIEENRRQRENCKMYEVKLISMFSRYYPFKFNLRIRKKFRNY